MPRLPYDAVDILLIDVIGKNISGSRLDVNVVARKDRYHQPAPDTNPRIKMIAIRDLSVQTHGSNVGIGLAEFCRSRAIEQMNVDRTRINVQTGGYPVEAGSALKSKTPCDCNCQNSIKMKTDAKGSRFHAMSGRNLEPETKQYRQSTTGDTSPAGSTPRTDCSVAGLRTGSQDGGTPVPTQGRPDFCRSDRVFVSRFFTYAPIRGGTSPSFGICASSGSTDTARPSIASKALRASIDV